MSVCKEHYEGRRGMLASDKGHRTYQRSFQILMDAPADTITSVLTVSGVPIIESAHPQDSGARLKTIEMQCENNLQTHWTLVCNYDSQLDSPENQEKNPLLRDPKFTFGTQMREVAQECDKRGNAYMNSACMKFDPPYSLQVAFPTIQIEVNKATFNYAFIQNVGNSCNSDTWLGFAPYYVRCESVNCSQEFENGAVFFKHTFNLIVSTPDPWMPTKILDVGMFERICNSSSSSSASPCGCDELAFTVQGTGGNGTLSGPWGFTVVGDCGHYTNGFWALIVTGGSAVLSWNGDTGGEFTWAFPDFVCCGGVTNISDTIVVGHTDPNGQPPDEMQVVARACKTADDNQNCCNGTLRAIRDSSGIVVSQNHLLDGFGRKAFFPTYLEFWPYNELIFTGNIP